MSHKPILAFAAAALIAPMLIVCCLGPTVAISAVVWISGWLSGLDLATTAALAILAGVLAYGLLWSRKLKAGGNDASPALRSLPFDRGSM